MKLSKRLNLILNLIMPCTVLADVGCDHGKLLFCALQNNVAKFVIGSDISQKSVLKTENLSKNSPFSTFITLQSDGFIAYSQEQLKDVGCIVIAGMGGQEIIKILDYIIKNKSMFTSLTQLVLQPQNNVVNVRDYLVGNYYKILSDQLIYDKQKYYNILSVTPFNIKRQKLTNKQLEFGLTNLITNNPDFQQFLQYKIVETQTILLNITKQKKPYIKQLKVLNHLLYKNKKNINKSV